MNVDLEARMDAVAKHDGRHCNCEVGTIPTYLFGGYRRPARGKTGDWLVLFGGGQNLYFIRAPRRPYRHKTKASSITKWRLVGALTLDLHKENFQRSEQLRLSVKEIACASQATCGDSIQK